MITTLEEFDNLLKLCDLDFSWYDLNVHQMRERIKKGGLMVLALHSNNAVHISWIGLNKNVNGCFYNYPLDYKSEAGIGGTMTAPNFRKKNVYKWVYAHIFKYLQERGVSRVIFETDPRIKFIGLTQSKLGSKRFGKIYILKILTIFKIIWVKS